MWLPWVYSHKFLLPVKMFPATLIINVSGYDVWINALRADTAEWKVYWCRREVRMNNSYLTACGIQLHQAMLHSREGSKRIQFIYIRPLYFCLGRRVAHLKWAKWHSVAPCANTDRKIWRYLSSPFIQQMFLPGVCRVFGDGGSKDYEDNSLCFCGVYDHRC